MLRTTMSHPEERKGSVFLGTLVPWECLSAVGGMTGRVKMKILYEDQDILVVQKPAGLAVQTAQVGQQDMVSKLKNYLRTQAAGAGGSSRTTPPYLGIIHRLDQPVEGLLVFAKNKRSAAELSRQLTDKGESGTLHKKYYAVFCGKVETKQGRLVDYLYKGNNNRAVILTEAEATSNSQAKPALLQYQVQQQKEVRGIILNLAEIQIDTGRFHQIRAQMAHAGMILVGDRKYGDDKALELSCLLGVNNVALCAYNLEFFHPTSKRSLSFQAKPQGEAFSYFFRK